MDRVHSQWYSTLDVFLRDVAAKRRPKRALWLRGATGVGKTHAVEAAAQRHAITLLRVTDVTAFAQLAADARAPHIDAVLLDDADALLDNEALAGLRAVTARALLRALSARPLIVVSAADLGTSSLLMTWRTNCSAFDARTVAPPPPAIVCQWLAAHVGDAQPAALLRIAVEAGGDLRRALTTAHMCCVVDVRVAAARRAAARVECAERLTARALDDTTPHEVARRDVARAEDAAANALDDAAAANLADTTALVTRAVASVRAAKLAFDDCDFDELVDDDPRLVARLDAAAAEGAAMNVFEACDVLLGVNRRAHASDADLARALAADRPAALVNRLHAYALGTFDDADALDTLATLTATLATDSSLDARWPVVAASATVRAWRRDHASRARVSYGALPRKDTAGETWSRAVVEATRHLGVVGGRRVMALDRERTKATTLRASDLDLVGLAHALAPATKLPVRARQLAVLTRLVAPTVKAAARRKRKAVIS